jgi:flagellar biosynthesis chaperone FliJ
MEASNAAMARGTTGAELASNAIASSNYRLWATRIQADIHRLMPAIELQRAHYREAQQEQEKVEMLRDQAYRTWKQERSRREQQATDQLFLLRRRKPAMQP